MPDRQQGCGSFYSEVHYVVTMHKVQATVVQLSSSPLTDNNT